MRREGSWGFSGKGRATVLLKWFKSSWKLYRALNLWVNVREKLPHVSTISIFFKWKRFFMHVFSASVISENYIY